MKIKFVDFWPVFDINNNKFVEALKVNFDDIEVLQGDSDENPDLLFYSRCGNGTEHYKYNDCIKIYFTGENDVPNFNEADYALSFHTLDFGERHLRYPLYMLYEYDWLAKPLEPGNDDAAFGRPFCSLLMRNFSNCDPKRLEIIDLMESYRTITYGGSWRNNIGGNVDEKIPFINKFKFNLALENSVVDGYVTEKLLEPLVASTVPIYWGTEYAKKDFNPDAFINVDDFSTLDSFLEYVKKVDCDKNLYLKYLKAPKLRSDFATDFDSNLADFLKNIVLNGRKKTVPYGEQGNYYKLNRRYKSLASNILVRAIAKLTKV